MVPIKMYNKWPLVVLITLACLLASLSGCVGETAGWTTEEEDVAFDVARLGIAVDTQNPQQIVDTATKAVQEGEKQAIGEEDEAAKMQRYKEMIEQRKRERRYRGERVDWRDVGKLTDEEVRLKGNAEGGHQEDSLRHRQEMEKVDKETATQTPHLSDAHHAVEKKDTSVPVVAVIGMTVTMAVAAGVGALPFFFVKTLSSRWSAVATAVACGVMFAASFDLIHEGQPYGGRLVVGGILLGAWFIGVMQRWLATMEDVSFGHLHGTRARRLLLMVGIMAAHAMGEGCGVGVSFCGDRGWAQGVLTTLAIGVHNVPEGLAKATVLVSQGASAHEALFWSVVTCLPQPLLAIPSFLFVDAFRALLPIALGFAAGCMIWMVFAELLPDSLKHISGSEVATAATLSAAALEGIRMAFETMQQSTRDDNEDATTKPFGPSWMLFPSLLPGIFGAALICWMAARRSLIASESVRLGGRYGTSYEHGMAMAGSMTGFASVVTLIMASRSGLRLLGLLRLSPGGPVTPWHLAAGLVFGVVAVLVLRRLIVAALSSTATTVTQGNGSGVNAGSVIHNNFDSNDENGIVIDRKNPLKHRGNESLPVVAQDVHTVPPSKLIAASLAAPGNSGSRTAALSLRAASIVLMIAVAMDSIGSSGRWVGIKWTHQMDSHSSHDALPLFSFSFSLPLCISFMAATVPRAAILGVCSRSAFGRHFKSWMAIVLSVAVATASGMGVQDIWVSRWSNIDSGTWTGMPLMIRSTANATAVAIGATGIAAFLLALAAVGNASQARYARFGMVVGVLWVGGILVMAAFGCFGAGMHAVCALFE